MSSASIRTKTSLISRVQKRQRMSNSGLPTLMRRACRLHPLTSCTRASASTAGQPEHLLAEARRLAKPGAVIALQEPDGSTQNCYPSHPAWDKLKMAVLRAFKGVGADLELAQHLYYIA
jgi:hypothetical protein